MDSGIGTLFDVYFSIYSRVTGGHLYTLSGLNLPSQQSSKAPKSEIDVLVLCYPCPAITQAHMLIKLASRISNLIYTCPAERSVEVMFFRASFPCFDAT
jgi:hypothetical protein